MLAILNNSALMNWFRESGPLNSFRHNIMLLVLLFALISCTVNWIDVSDNPKYHDMIGTVYQTKELMNIYGIVSDLQTGDISYHLITAMPGIAGREVVDVGRLEKGSYLEITKVVRSSIPRVAMQDIRFKAKILTGHPNNNLVAFIDSAEKTYTKDRNNSFILNPSHFKKI